MEARFINNVDYVYSIYLHEKLNNIHTNILSSGFIKLLIQFDTDVRANSDLNTSDYVQNNEKLSILRTVIDNMLHNAINMVLELKQRVSENGTYKNSADINKVYKIWNGYGQYNLLMKEHPCFIWLEIQRYMIYTIETEQNISNICTQLNTNDTNVLEHSVVTLNDIQNRQDDIIDTLKQSIKNLKKYRHRR